MNINIFRVCITASVIHLSGCSTGPVMNDNPVTWYAINGWDDTVTFELYDQVCDRFLRDVRLTPETQQSMTTCGDESGNASIRYRRTRIAATGFPWSREDRVTPNQTVYMR